MSNSFESVATKYDYNPIHLTNASVNVDAKIENDYYAFIDTMFFKHVKKN